MKIIRLSYNKSPKSSLYKYENNETYGRKYNGTNKKPYDKTS